MKRFLLSLIIAAALLVAPGIVRADLTINNLNYHIQNDPPPATITFLQCTDLTTNTGTYTFTATNTGTASADRLTLVGVMVEDSGTAFSVSTLTIAGDSASKVVESDTASALVNASFWQLVNTAGTSEDIVVAMSEPATGATICVWQINNLSSTTAVDSGGVFDTAAGAAADTLAVSSGGVLAGVCANQDDTQSTTWTNATERTDATTGSGEMVQSSADTTTNGGTLAVTCDYTGAGDTALALVSYR